MSSDQNKTKNSERFVCRSVWYCTSFIPVRHRHNKMYFAHHQNGRPSISPNKDVLYRYRPFSTDCHPKGTWDETFSFSDNLQLGKLHVYLLLRLSIDKKYFVCFFGENNWLVIIHVVIPSNNLTFKEVQKLSGLVPTMTELLSNTPLVVTCVDVSTGVQ